ncbi:MAG: hypothetical protein A2521_11775 [Deltaproteobacteria bacterium RIFOXYD12_FULL_57_12]|nr:MAG: hypothetical protein A2521_11775 [Deltaproteobacteria bacterium RIFOXYD12_FULL_57_12]
MPTASCPHPTTDQQLAGPKILLASATVSWYHARRLLRMPRIKNQTEALRVTFTERSVTRSFF